MLPTQQFAPPPGRTPQPALPQLPQLPAQQVVPAPLPAKTPPFARHWSSGVPDAASRKIE
jgi:hypothetical protein